MDQMEKYFEQSTEEKLKDSRPDLYYQVGATPENTELPRDNSKISEKYTKGNEVTSIKGRDSKWRYFWKAGIVPKKN